MDINKMKDLSMEEVDRIGCRVAGAYWWAVRLTTDGLLLALKRLYVWCGSDDVLNRVSRAMKKSGAHNGNDVVNLDKWSVDDAKWFKMGCMWCRWYDESWSAMNGGVGKADMETTDVQGVVRDGDYGLE